MPPGTVFPGTAHRMLQEDGQLVQPKSEDLVLSTREEFHILEWWA